MGDPELKPLIVSSELGDNHGKLADATGVNTDLSEVIIQRLFKLLEDIESNRLKFTKQLSEPYEFSNQFIFGHMIDGFELVQRDDQSQIVLSGSTMLCSFVPHTGVNFTPGQVVSITLEENTTGDTIEFQIGRYDGEEKQFILVSYRNDSLLITDSDYVFGVYCKIFDFHNDINDEVQFPTLPRKVSRRDI